MRSLPFVHSLLSPTILVYTYRSVENVGALLETVWHPHGTKWSIMLRSISGELNDENTMALYRVHLICAVLQSYILERISDNYELETH